MKTLMPDIVGNEALKSRLGNDILSQKLAHAYIIEGAPGSGRHTLALNIAAAVACENRDDPSLALPCRRCNSCRKIFSGISPDIITVGCDGKATVGVDKIRFIKTDAPVFPNDLDIKVYIIEDADKMTVQAQNAFLLTLEEPPRHVMMLLLCEHADAMLETIRSRAPVLRTCPVPDADIEKYLLRSDVTAALKRAKPGEFAEIISASNGCIGRALTLLNDEKRAPVIAARSHARHFAEVCSRRPSGPELLELTSEFPQSRGDVCERLSLIMLALRDLTVLKKSDDAELCFYTDREAAQELSDRYTAASLLSLYSACDEALTAVTRNGNIRLILLDLILNSSKTR